MATHKADWQADIKRREVDLAWILGQDLADDWTRAQDIGMTAACYTKPALDLAYADIDHPVAMAFLDNAIRYMEWVERERVIEAKKPPHGALFDWEGYLQSRGHAVGLRHRRTEPIWWLRASKVLETIVENPDSEGWDEMDEIFHLTAIRLALIAGELTRARELMARHRIYWNVPQGRALRALVNESTFPVPQGKTRETFRAWFDEIRDPAKRGAGFERLETGLIWDRFFVSPDQTIDWVRALEAISE